MEKVSRAERLRGRQREREIKRDKRSHVKLDRTNGLRTKKNKESRDVVARKADKVDKADKAVKQVKVKLSSR
jgi:hypothetical protein